nr:reverse transcriptase domain-containing protein [Tanacetum cinerariifolium]
ERLYRPLGIPMLHPMLQTLAHAFSNPRGHHIGKRLPHLQRFCTLHHSKAQPVPYNPPMACDGSHPGAHPSPHTVAPPSGLAVACNLQRRPSGSLLQIPAVSKMMKYYNSRVRGVAFKPGDFVYRSNDASYAVADGKLRPQWEGPYEVTDALGNGAYKLWSMDGTTLPRTWNVINLKRCYL